jgi:hypothetical protein
MRRPAVTLLNLSTVASVLIAAALLVVTFASRATPSNSWLTYRDAKLGYSISYPRGWKLDPNYVDPSFGPDHDIHGVAFDVPESVQPGTNLSHNDTNVSVETASGTGPCDARRFLADAPEQKSVTDHGVRYSYAENSDAGAGNFYDITIYALPETTPCLAVRYFIHTTNIANYDPGTIKEFDRAKLIAKFDSIRRTLVLAPVH